MKEKPGESLAFLLYICGMLANVYTLQQMNDHQVIRIAHTRMHIHVYDLSRHNFQASPADNVFYGIGTDQLAFVIHDEDLQQVDTTMIALRWYAATNGYKTMDFSKEDPRSSIHAF